MPKRVGYIYERMADENFIRRCILIGTKDSKKRKRRDVQRVLENKDEYVVRMKAIVEKRSFRPKIPHQRTIYDPCSQKERTISSVPFFPDGLMHIMIVQAMMDVLMHGMSHWSCASVPGRGTARIRKKIQSAMKNDPKGTKYAMELDIKSYYPSIPLDKLLEAFEHKIKDKEFLLLIALTLAEPEEGKEKMSLAEAEHSNLCWRDITAGKKGINIGFYLCQWSANFYLESLDHFIKEQLSGAKYALRYMDNITILGPNKRKLHRAREGIEQCLKERLGLWLKSNWQIFRTRKRQVCAVGFRYGLGYTTLRRLNFLRLTRQIGRARKRARSGKAISYRQAAGLLSRIGQLKHCNSYKLKQKYIEPDNLIEKLKGVVRNESKRRLKPRGIQLQYAA